MTFLGVFIGIPLAIIALVVAAVYWFRAFSLKKSGAAAVRASMIKSFACGVVALLLVGLSMLGYIFL